MREIGRLRGVLRLGTLLFGASLGLVVGDLVLVALGARVDPTSTIGRSAAIDVGAALSATSFATVGLILTRTSAGRAMGVPVELIGLAMALSLFTATYASYGLLGDSSLPGWVASAWLANWVWLPLLSLMLFFLPALFPDGHLPSVRWRWAAALAVAVALAGFAGPAFRDGPMQPPFQAVTNPLGISQARSLTAILLDIGNVGTIVLPILGVAALVLRYRRSAALGRAQLKWFVASVIPLVLGSAISNFGYNEPGFEPLVAIGALLLMLGLIGIPIAIGIAVLRYRLYDIDLLVNRTVLYGSVTAILTAALVIANVAAQRLVTAMTGQRSELVAAALGVGAAVLYGPTQRRLRPLIDRILPARAVLTLLFNDIVDSTGRILELGDQRWRGVLDRYRTMVRHELARWGGREINTAGDAFFAVFDRAVSGVRCAWAIRAGVRTLGLECRTGLHLGQVELRGEQVSGLAVHAAARVMAEAGPGEILISQNLRAALGAEEMTLADRGGHTLKGLPEEWHLYAVEAA